jgi:uncharacterized protein (TIGR00304 family)
LKEEQIITQALLNLGLILILVGFAIVFIAVILLVFTAVRDKGKIRGGGAVVIGPFPIVFGTDKESVKVLLILSIALIALLLIFMIFSAKIFG